MGISLQREAFSDGFWIVLFQAWRNRSQSSLAICVQVFNGGLPLSSYTFRGKNLTAAAVSKISRLISSVLDHNPLVVLCGNAHRLVWQNFFVGHAQPTRVLDLIPAAVALHPTLKPNAPVESVLEAYRVSHLWNDNEPPIQSMELLLWAVLAQAERQGLDWDTLFALPASRIQSPTFHRYTFGPAVLNSLPAAPGVYAMYDKDDILLYVGKSQNLRRRLSEYFRGSLRLDPKIGVIRNRIHHFEAYPTGSDLEALLLEQQLIAERGPAINVQRAVREKNVRYKPRSQPVLLMTASLRPEHADLFVFGFCRGAFQITLNPHVAHPPPWLTHFFQSLLVGEADNATLPGSVKAWGILGEEICHRYFAAHRARLHWCRLDADFLEQRWWGKLRAMAKAVLSGSEEPAEYR